MKLYDCTICGREIIKEANGGLHPSPGDHDPAQHVARAYGTAIPPKGTKFAL